MNLTTGTRTVTLPSGRRIPALGQGTWHMARDPRRRADEIAALRLGIDLGMTLIDTAEMYADGGSEELVGEAISGRRDELFLVSKVLPNHATRRGTIAACEAQPQASRHRPDRPLSPALARLSRSRKPSPRSRRWSPPARSGSWGVSNFDVDDMEELIDLRRAATRSRPIRCSTTSPAAASSTICCRGAASAACRSWPIRRSNRAGCCAIRRSRRSPRDTGATAAQVALAWVLRHDGVFAIPQSGNPAHVRENSGALEIRLTAHDLADLDRAFPPPNRKQTLAML